MGTKITVLTLATARYFLYAVFNRMVDACSKRALPVWYEHTAIVEKSFRQSKDDDLVSIMPLRHWTDGKIRCHILSCIIALTYLRLIEIRLRGAGLELSAAGAMEQMRKLHSCLFWESGKSKPVRMIEEPTENHAAIMDAFGYEVSRGVLQKTTV